MDKEQELLEYLRKIYTEWLNKNGNAMRPETLDEQLALYLINKEHEIAKLKEDKTKILTDIRDYLVERQRCLAIESRMCPKIRETALVLSMIEDLQKYAEKLGVEL